MLHTTEVPLNVVYHYEDEPWQLLSSSASVPDRTPFVIVSTRLILPTISNVTFANQLNLWRSRKTPSIPSPFGELITFTFLLDTEEPLMLLGAPSNMKIHIPLLGRSRWVVPNRKDQPRRLTPSAPPERGFSEEFGKRPDGFLECAGLTALSLVAA